MSIDIRFSDFVERTVTELVNQLREETDDAPLSVIRSQYGERLAGLALSVEVLYGVEFRDALNDITGRFEIRYLQAVVEF